MIDIVALASNFAKEKHEGQTRRFVGGSYWEKHLAVVVGILEQKGITDKEILAAAWLHDCVEDTETTYGEIQDNFGDTVSSLVFELTSVPGYDNFEKSTYLSKKMQTMSDDALLIKLADRYANVLDGKHATPKYRHKYAEETIQIMEQLKSRVEKTGGVHLELYRDILSMCKENIA